MHILSPQQAAEIATGVYELQTSSVTKAQRTARLGSEGLFKVSDESRFKGKSGSVFKQLSGFGYIAEGEGIRSGEVLCATRGTTSRYDWASNLNVGVQTGPGGHFVHAGFNEVWKSCRASLELFLRNKNPAHVHCVGHSLGGALAFLNADYFATRGIPVSVYTFGAPRTGLEWFASEFTRRAGADQIFRTSHVADPVPMIPLFPFAHAPSTGSGYVVGGSAEGKFIRVSAHSMDASYFELVQGKSWGDLRIAATEVTDPEVQSWLQATSQGRGVLAYSAAGLQMIGRLLRWMLRKAGTLLAGAVGLNLMAGATVLDQIAGMIARGAAVSKELATAGMAMARAVFNFLGYQALSAYDLTMQFLRWMLGLLFARLSGIAQRALALL